MKIIIERKDKSIPLPQHETKGSIAIDLHASKRVKCVPGNGLIEIPLNEKIKVPEGYGLLVKDRSSLFKTGFSSHTGLIDRDYHGKDDWITFMCHYTSRTRTHVIEKGDRVCQAILFKTETFEIEETTLDGDSRGGLGSTGK